MNGTNLKDSSLLNCETDGSTSLPGGKYAKINLIRGKTCVLKDSFGQIIASDLSSYFLLDRDYSIEITPSEAITVGLRIDSKNNNYSGCGHFTFDIYECATKNGDFIQVYTIKANTCQAKSKVLLIVLKEITNLILFGIIQILVALPRKRQFLWLMGRIRI